MSIAFFVSLACCYSVSNTSLLSPQALYEGRTNCLIAASWGTVSNVFLWRLVLCSNLCCKVCMILYVSDESKYCLAFSVRSLKILSFGSPLAHLLFFKSSYNSHLTRHCTWNIVSLRSLGQYDG